MRLDFSVSSLIPYIVMGLVLSVCELLVIVLLGTWSLQNAANLNALFELKLDTIDAILVAILTVLLVVVVLVLKGFFVVVSRKVGEWAEKRW